MRADGAGDVVPHGRCGRLIGGDLAGFHLFLDEGVVVRELLQGAGAESVAATVADVGKEEIGWSHEARFRRSRDGPAIREWRRNVQQRDEGGTHAGLPGDVEGAFVDESVRGEDGGLQPCLRLGPGSGGSAEMIQKSAGSETAGDLTGSGPAHTIADDKGADLGRDRAGVFVMGAGATNIGQHGVDEMVSRHGLRRWVWQNCTRAGSEGQRHDRGITNEAM